MKNIIRYLSVLTTLFFLSFPSQAEIYSFITSSTKEGSKIVYDFTISAWPAPPRTTVHPCSQVGLTNKCYANINHRHTNANRGGISSRNDSTFNQRCRGMDLNTLPDAISVRNYIYNNCFGGLPYTSSTNHVGAVIRNECVTLFLTASPNAGDGYMYPESICGVAPPPGGICSFDMDRPAAVLNHGRIADDEIDGNQATDTLTMKCSKDTVVRIYSVTETDARLRLANNLYTRLTLNNIPLTSASGGVPVYVRENYPSNALLKSTLETTGPVTSGSFYGNMTIIMTID